MDRLISAAISLRSSEDNSERKEDTSETSSPHPSPRSTFMKWTESNYDNDDDDFMFFENSRQMLSSVFASTNKIGSLIIKHEASEVQKRLFDIMTYRSVQENVTHTVEGKDSSKEECCDIENSNKRRKINSEPDHKQRMTSSSDTDSDHTIETVQNQPTNEHLHDDDGSTISSGTTTVYSLHNDSKLDDVNLDNKTHFIFPNEQLEREKMEAILYQKAFHMKRMSTMFRMLLLSQQMLLDELQTCMDEKELFE